MTEANYGKLDDSNFICDRCGQKNKRSNGKFEWTGLLVCTRCWEPKHPWLLPRPVVIDGKPLPDSRPRPNPVYITTTLPTLSIWGVQYQRFSGEIVPNLICGDWDEIIGGPGNLPFNATNFPLR